MQYMLDGSSGRIQGEGTTFLHHFVVAVNPPAPHKIQILGESRIGFGAVDGDGFLGNFRQIGSRFCCG